MQMHASAYLHLKDIARKALANTDSKIIQATMDLVGELGYKGTTTRQISERAGFDEVTLFRRFGSKNALAKKAISFAQSQIRVELESAGKKKTGNLEIDLTKMALLLMEVLDRHREAVVAIMFEAKREEYFAAIIAGMVEFILNLVREYVRSYGFEKPVKKDELEAITLSVVSFVFFRIVIRERLLDKKFMADNRKRELEKYVEFLLRNASFNTAE